VLGTWPSEVMHQVVSAHNNCIFTCISLLPILDMLQYLQSLPSSPHLSPPPILLPHSPPHFLTLPYLPQPHRLQLDPLLTTYPLFLLPFRNNPPSQPLQHNLIPWPRKINNTIPHLPSLLPGRRHDAMDITPRYPARKFRHRVAEINDTITTSIPAPYLAFRELVMAVGGSAVHRGG
jgi:hypothetical protein